MYRTKTNIFFKIKMKKFRLKIIGNGKINLILIHGWAFDSNVWIYIIQNLYKYFKIYLIDLPGYGINSNITVNNIEDIIRILKYNCPNNSIWIGWSLGGLIVNKIANKFPKKILGIINIASSPCFIKKISWPGNSKKIFYNIYKNMKNNYFKTIKNFLEIQMLYKKNNFLKKKLLNHSQPKNKSIKIGLKIILEEDFRKFNYYTSIPILYILGEYDSIIPNKTYFILKENKNINCVNIQKAAHTLILFNYEEVCSHILIFIKNIK